MNELENEFGSDLCERITKLSVKRTFGPNEVIFSEGESAEFLPIVVHGRVKLVRYPEPGKEVILGVFANGSIFAIPPAIEGKRFPASAVATEKSELLLLPRKDFTELMASSQVFSESIMRRMCGLLRDKAETIQILATRSADVRVANVILKLAGQIPDHNVKRIMYRRQDVAQMAGLTIESTIRSVRKLADMGLFSIVQGTICLESTEPLRDFVRTQAV